MNALDHFREGEKLLAAAERTPAAGDLRAESIPVNALMVDQARAHFEAAQTIIAALNTLDVPAAVYEAWLEIGLVPRKPAPVNVRDLELDDSCEECEGKGRNCAAHGGRPGIPVGGESRG